jgi:hypothetical protein
MAPLQRLLDRCFGSRRGRAMPTRPPLTTDQVLREEAAAIHGATFSGESGIELYRTLNKLNSAALCLSGGGIRSAAFALGITQALAAHPRSARANKVDPAGASLLAQFHYLSTVSGGGYIGSWLSAWRMRASFDTIWRNLVGRPDGPDSEPPAIGWLRSYSNYLTPRLGVMSADSWAIVAVYLRNLILNWFIILTALCAAILAVKIIVVAFIGLSNLKHATQPGFLIICAGVLSLLAALRFATRNRPSRQRKLPRRVTTSGRDADRVFVGHCLILSLFSAIAFTQYFAIADVNKWPITTYSLSEVLGIGAMAGAAIYAGGWALGWPARRELRDFAAWTASGLAYGVLVGIGYYYYPLPTDPGLPPVVVAVVSSPVVYLIVGVPWILLAQCAADMTFVGLTSYHDKFNADQEWLGRAAGWLLLTAVVWTLGMFVTFAGFLTTIRSTSASNLYLLLAYWIVPITAVAGLIVAIFGTSNLSRFNFASRGIAPALTEMALAIAAPLFVGALIFSLSIALDHLLLGRHLFADPAFGVLLGELKSSPPVYSHWTDTLVRLGLGFAVCALLAVLASRCININRFSLHALYRNRLGRAFLGASRHRTPNPFTGFDEHDDPPMHALWPRKPEGGGRATAEAGGWRPFHVLNLTLNIVSARRLAWQERKAAPFTVSPLHCGTSNRSYRSAKDSGNVGERREGAYRPSRRYGGPQGMTLGTAMAISGAAANPNMGYHSSPSVTFLMTMFNVRLGWWLGNPGPEGARCYTRDGPAVAIRPLVQETLGLTTDSRSYVHLSDGGHFDNLGLYEMVRRRCRFILVSDAGRDPAYIFEDLGNAVRKIQIDLGVPIQFRSLEVLKRRPLDGNDLGEDCNYHAIAEIDYRAADDSDDVQNGLIIYVKAGYHGTESAGIRSYAMANLGFPHQSTANQWFSESQFESYRSLGFEIMNGLLSKALDSSNYANDPTLENLIAAFKRMAVEAADTSNVVTFEQRALSRSDDERSTIGG